MNKRRKLLVRPRIQILSSLIVVATVGTGLLLLTLLSLSSFAQLAAAHPEVGESFVAEARGELLHDLVLALLALVPIAFAAGIVMTFRVVGPVHRAELYLMQVLRGEDVGPCRFRQGDELHDLAELLSDVVAKGRRPSMEPALLDPEPSLKAARSHEDERIPA